MDPQQFAKQMIEFEKATLDNTFNAMSMVQDQMEKMTNLMMDQAAWIPQEGKKVVNDYLATCRKTSSDFKTMMNDGFNQIQSCFCKNE
ncbi:MAG: hypothetical protein HQK57_10280 [Deltaproteobacteria bacterium]|nr:hypothetical protein [Deltaproteobacteria bacterium]